VSQELAKAALRLAAAKLGLPTKMVARDHVD
jgi:ribosomal protein L16/L10AE